MRKLKSVSDIRVMGFTLIEVMVATAILSLTTVLICEIFFKSLDIYEYCSNYFKTAYWVDEKIWEAQDNLIRFGTLKHLNMEGELPDMKKSFCWKLSYNSIDDEQGLYRINLDLSRPGDGRRFNISRTAYTIYEKKKEKKG